ncbi:FGGY-family carbohydrate kinase [Rubellimicrobium sp. CFH 75288]|uniref:xylulokinase n=1 Tax=Rubellimicrobium sp. CFH 75288 TaxID=2697034 RepID=UPI0014132930|nr:FGGY family carbohydrate kinase [Rubellimicrobium sp. CFH 75288]NAZ35934.1 carbohydrate kinase [Rubellimicrobium sp. CFH 75288]
MAGERILAFDLGTSALKWGLFEPDGRLVTGATLPLTLHRRLGGVVEQDADEWRRAMETAFAGLRAQGLLGDVAAIGITSQVNTHVFVDRHGRALAPAILWQDTRAAEEAASLDARIAREDRVRWWGTPMGIDASHALARMAWVGRHQPEIWDRTASVLLPKDVLLLALTGERLSDPFSHIGLVGSDLRYPDDLLALVPGASERLPPLRSPEAVAGEARLDGRSVPVAVGIMDAWAGFLGAGLSEDGDALWLSGTSEVLAAAADTPSGEAGILVFPPLWGLRVHAGPTQSGGASLLWLSRVLESSPDALIASVEAAGPDLAAPLFLPHLAGERAPLWDPEARGAFLGLDAGTGREALVLGVMIGVALSARLLVEALDRSTGRRAETLLCGGGGFRSDVWAQVRADVMGRSLRRAAVADTGLTGAAVLAAVAAGLRPGVREGVRDLVRWDRTFEPDPIRAARHAELFDLYRPAWEALRPLNKVLSRRTL